MLRLNKSCSNFAFTLAEMLVVMFIVGVMAMLAIPTVIKTSRDRVFADLLNETYQKIEIALVVDKIMGFDVSSFGFSAITKKYKSEEFSKLLKKKLKIIQYCGLDEGCFISDILKGYKLRMLNGSGILVNDDFRGEKDPIDDENDILGAVYIDVDGPKSSNKPGIDQFGFYTTYKGLIPMGGPQDNLVPFSRCLEQGGFACSAWILLNKNMDYNKCPNVLDWNNKTSCN